MGKTTVADYLVRTGELVIDTDMLARDLVAPGQPALRRIAESFGEKVLTAEGSLNRSALAELVFADEARRQLLESILHPRIREAWKKWALQCSERGARRAVVVIPLLFETGAEMELDLSICIACSPQTQHARLRARGWTDTGISNRIAAQLPIREKMDKAHRVVWNEAGLDVCESQAARIFSSL